MMRNTAEYSCPAARRLFIASAIAAVVGTICIGVGIGLPFWHEGDLTHDGVFQVCKKTLKDCETHDDNGVKYRSASFIPLVWGLLICGLIFLALGLIFLSIVYPCRMLIDHCKVALAIFVIVFLAIAVLCILAAMIIYLDWFSRYDPRYQDSAGDLWDDVGFSWYITLLGVILITIAAICFGLHVFFLLYYSEETTKIKSFN